MHAIPGITDDLQPIWPCLNNTDATGGPACTLEDICGFGGFHGKAPDQVPPPLSLLLIIVVSSDPSYLPTCWCDTYPPQSFPSITSGSRYGESHRNSKIHVGLLSKWNHGIHSRCKFRWRWKCKYRM